MYGYPGQRIIAYDNERPKGDHRHRDDTEEAYLFESPEKLIDDFLHEVENRREK
ncbi:toxin-antitoxin system TumE family protein [Candidatus Methylospira mobilis]|uniref:toxin-antitoxin system TumE family protein n=1 Tax=Candidatus Methylospira mobilis TaxID=1808979 RepID=UPI00387E45F3